MAPKKNYSRYFIILQEDEKGYALDKGKTPSGYVKLEKKNNKCKVSYYVQNLNAQMQPYDMVLICDKKDAKKILKLGKVIIDDYGRVDISNEYDPDNIMDSGISMDKIVGAGIIKVVDNNFKVLMSGFTTGDIPKEWRSFEIFETSKEEVKEEVKKEVRESVEEEKENIFEEYEENIEKLKGHKKDKVESKDKVRKEEKKSSKSKDASEIIEEDVEENVKAKERKAAEKVKEEVQEKDIEISEEVEENKKVEEVRQNEEEEEINEADELQCNEDSKEEQCEESRESKEDAENNEHEHTTEFSNVEEDESRYPVGIMGDFYKSLVRDCEEISDMSKEIKHCKWYKVPVKSIETLYDMSDYDKYTVLYYPMLCYYSYIQKHGNYAIGYNYDDKGKLKYIMYGIPGTKHKMDQPFGGKTGFVTWIPSKHNKDMGHWIMFYDIKNSTVVIPFKKR